MIYTLLFVLGCVLLVGFLSYDALYFFDTLAYQIVTIFIMIVILSNIVSRAIAGYIRSL